MGRADNRTLVEILAALTTLSGFNDNVETLLTALNTYVDGLEGFSDGLETLITSSNTKLDSVVSGVDGLETLIGSTNTKLDSVISGVDGLEGFTDGLEAAIASTNTKLDSLISNEAMTTPSVSQVASSASSVTLLSSNTSRKGFTLYNDSTQIAYVKFGTTASSSSYTVKMAAGSFYESPERVYTGRIDAIWVSANGNMLVTELT